MGIWLYSSCDNKGMVLLKYKVIDILITKNKPSISLEGLK
jgi:hypothetical protein